MATSLKSKNANQVIYLYGITRNGHRTPPGVAGVDGRAAVEPVPCAGLVCWISRVDKKEFAESLARNMENLEWLAEVSVRHQQVVGAIAAAHDILPARFGTVFRTQASLAADVGQHKATLERDLRRIRGCEEWGLKMFRVQTRPQIAPQAQSGRDYLRAKAAVLKVEPRQVAGTELKGLMRALDAVAIEIVAGGGAVSRGQRGLEWQGSLLVKRSQRRKLQQVVAQFARQGDAERRLELSGPWPPYSFVSRAQEKGAGRR